VVQCNDRIQPIKLKLVSDETEHVLVEHVTLANFEPDQLRADDLVVMDDVQKVTDSIRMCISVCAHHYDLVSLFVVTHSLLGHLNFELLSLVHRVVMFMKATSNIRLSKYIGSHFFPDPDLKAALAEMASFCHKRQEILCVELSSKGDAEMSVPLMGASHLTSLSDTNGYCLVYPQPFAGMEYSSSFEQADSDIISVDETAAGARNVVTLDGLPKHALVALPVSVVKRSSAVVHAATVNDDKMHGTECSAEDEWNATSETIEEMIDRNFKPTRWKACKNVAAEILSRRDLCVFKNGRFFHRKGKPHTKVALLDFLHQVTRQPNKDEKFIETPKTRLYSQYVQDFLSRGALPSTFRNKSFHPSS